MTPVYFNFSSAAPGSAHRLGWMLCFCFLIIGSGLLAYSWQLNGLLTEQQQLLAHEMKHAQTQGQSMNDSYHLLSGSSYDSEIDHRQGELRIARQVIDQLDTPWNTLFSAIESTYDDNVTLLGIEPEPTRQEVKLIAEAKDFSAMAAYLRKARQSKVLHDAWLLNHQVNSQDPLRPVRFTVSATWVLQPQTIPPPNELSVAPPASDSMNNGEVSPGAQAVMPLRMSSTLSSLVLLRTP